MLLARPCIGRVTSAHGYRIHPITGVRTMHHGVDIAPRIEDRPKATIPIYAAAAGTVVRRSPNGSFGGYGNTIILRHVIKGKTYETLYAHLKSFSVTNGQKVRQGQQIGVMGATGNVTGRHLHFELHSPRWVNTYSGELDPAKYYTLVPRLGAIGSDVNHIQTRLVAHGHKVAIDGHFGAATDKAARAFQKSKGLKMDGIVGTATLNALNAKPTTKPVTPPKKEEDEEELILSDEQRKEIAAVFKEARKQGIFDSDQHEKNIVNKKMTMSRLQYLQTIIAGAGINNGKRIGK